MTAYNLFAYCGNNPIVRFDPTGMWYEEIGYLTDDQIQTLEYKISNLAQDLKSKSHKRDAVVGFGGLVIGFITWKPIAVVAGIYSVGDYLWTTCGSSIENELEDIRADIGEMQYRYRNGNYRYRISLLFGSHNNQLKLEVLDSTSYIIPGVYPVQRYTVYKSIDSFVHDFQNNKIHGYLKEFLSELGIPLEEIQVLQKYSYS